MKVWQWKVRALVLVLSAVALLAGAMVAARTEFGLAAPGLPESRAIPEVESLPLMDSEPPERLKPGVPAGRFVGVPGTKSEASLVAAGSGEFEAGDARAAAVRDVAVVEELLEEKTESRAVFRRADGSLLVQEHMAPVFYRDASGRWADINPTVVCRGGGRL